MDNVLRDSYRAIQLHSVEMKSNALFRRLGNTLAFHLIVPWQTVSYHFLTSPCPMTRVLHTKRRGISILHVAVSLSVKF